MLRDKKTDGLPQKAKETPREGLWNGYYQKASYQRQVYGDDTSVLKGCAFLNSPDIDTIEDWGCGYGGVKLYIAPHQQYVGVDGSQSLYADKHADLERYISSPDAIFMHHVLEHNPNWEKVLDNALLSFRKRMVLILFTPFQETTRVLREYPNWEGTGHSMWDIGFCRDDIVSCLQGLRYFSEEGLATRTGYGVEHIFYLERLISF